MRRRTSPRSRWAWAVTALGAVVSVASLTPVPHVSAAGGLVLVSQRFNVGPDDRLEFVIERPAALTDAAMETMTIEFIAHEPVSTRDDVISAATGDLPFTVDVVDLPTQRIAVLADGNLRVRMPVELVAEDPFAVQLSRAGVYPVSLRLSSGTSEIGRLTTFVQRVPGDGEPRDGDLRVALAATTSADIGLDDSGSPTVTADDVNALQALVEMLEASTVPVSVALRPLLLEAVRDTGPSGDALITRLTDVLDRHDLLSVAQLPLDPSHAADAGADDLYTRWLRAGEDTMLELAGVAPSRAAHLATAPLSRPGVNLLRDLGARVLVLTPDTYDSLPGSLQGYTDTSLLVGVGTVARTDDAVAESVDAAVIDRGLAALLAVPSDSAAATAARVIAELLAIRTEVLAAGGNVQRHGMTLGTLDLSAADPGIVAAVTDLLGRTPGLRDATVGEVGATTDRLQLGSVDVVVDVPDDSGGLLTERLDLVDELTVSSRSAGSMLEGTDQQRRWTTLISLLPSSALDDEEVGSIADTLRAEQDAVLHAVEMPAGFSFNLTSRAGTVPITFHNPTAQPITVLVRLTSSKMVVPGGDEVVTLEPDAYTEIRVPIEARTNGRMPVTLEVFTPSGGVPLTAPIALEARVLALAALGNFVFAAVVLLVVVWWGRHAIRHRRRRSEASTLTA